MNSANIQFVEEEEHIDFDRRTGLVAGVFAVWPANARFAPQLETLYSQKGARLDAPGIDLRLKLDFIDIPVLLRVSGPPNSTAAAFHVFGGPSPSFRVRAKGTATFEGRTDTQDVSDNIARFDLGLVVGGGVEVGRFVADIRYTWGMTNINTDESEDDTTIKNRVFAAMVGIRF